jgi:hypothetical protein
MALVVALLTVAVAVQALLIAGLLRSHATILRRLHELGAGVEDEGGGHPGAVSATEVEGARRTAAGRAVPPAAPAGRPAADVSGVGPTGEALAVRVVGANTDTVLAFLSSGCETCGAFWDGLRDPGLDERTRLVVVTRGPEEELPAEVAALAPPDTVVVMSSAAWSDYAVPGSPYLVHVDGPRGRVRGEGTGVEWPQVRRMLLQADGQPGSRRAAKARADARREQEIDRTLLAAGVAPGDPSLYRSADELAPPPESEDGVELPRPAQRPGGGMP